MGTDLVSACIFCAGWLLGMDLTPRDGLSGQMGFSYATMARRYDVSPDPRGLLRRHAEVRPGRPGQRLAGARRPRRRNAGERVARARGLRHLARPAGAQGARRTSTGSSPSGTGRYENFALLGRLKVGERDSVELAVDRRAESATDLISVGEREPRARLLALALGLAGRRGRGLAPPLAGARGRGGLPLDEAGRLQLVARILPERLGQHVRRRRRGALAVQGVDAAAARRGDVGRPRRPPREPSRLRRPRRVAAGVLRGGAPGRRLLLDEDGPLPHVDVRPPAPAVRVDRRARDGADRPSTAATTRIPRTTSSTSTSRSATPFRRRSACASASCSRGARRRCCCTTRPAACPTSRSTCTGAASSAAGSRPRSARPRRPSSSGPTSPSARPVPVTC